MGASQSKNEGRPVSRQNAESGSHIYKNSAASLIYKDYKLVVDEKGKRKLVSAEEAAQIEAEIKVKESLETPKSLRSSSRGSTLERKRKKASENDDEAARDSFKSIVPSEKETVYESVIESSNEGEVNDDIVTIDDLKLASIPGTPGEDKVVEWLVEHIAEGDLNVPPPPPPMHTLPDIEWADEGDEELQSPIEITHLVAPKKALKPPEEPPPPPPPELPEVISTDLPAESRSRSSSVQKEKVSFFQRAFRSQRQPKKITKLQEVLDETERKKVKEKQSEQSLFGSLFGKPNKNRRNRKSILVVRPEEPSVKDSFSVGDEPHLSSLEVDPKSDDDSEALKKKKKKRKSFIPLQKSSSNELPKARREHPKKNVSWSDSDLSKSKKKAKKNKLEAEYSVKDDIFYDDIESSEEIDVKAAKKSEESFFQRSFSVPHIWKKKDKDLAKVKSSVAADIDVKKNDKPVFSFVKSPARKSNAKKEKLSMIDGERSDGDVSDSEFSDGSSIVPEKEIKKKDKSVFSFMKSNVRKSNAKIEKVKVVENENANNSSEVNSSDHGLSDSSFVVPDKETKKKEKLSFGFMKSPVRKSNAKEPKIETAEVVVDELENIDKDKEVFGVKPRAKKADPNKVKIESKEPKKPPKEVIKLIEVFGSNDFSKQSSDGENEPYNTDDISMSSQNEVEEKQSKSFFSSKKKKRVKEVKDVPKKRTDGKHIQPLLGPDGNFHDLEEPIEIEVVENVEENNTNRRDRLSLMEFLSEQAKTKKTDSKKKKQKVKKKSVKPVDVDSSGDEIEKKKPQNSGFLSFNFGSKGSLKEKDKTQKERLKTELEEVFKEKRSVANNEVTDQENLPDKKSFLFNFGSKASIGKTNKNELQDNEDSQIKSAKKNKPKSPEKNKSLLSIFGSKDFGSSKKEDKPISFGDIVITSMQEEDNKNNTSVGSDSSGVGDMKRSSPDNLGTDSGSKSSSASSDSGLNIKTAVGLWGPKRKSQPERGSYSFIGDEPELDNSDTIVLRGFKLLDDEGHTLEKSKDFGRQRPTSYHESIRKNTFNLRSFSIGDELNKASDTESADHGSTDKTSVTKLTEDGIKKNRFNLLDFVRRNKDRVEDSEQGKIIGETAKDVATAPVEGDRVVYAELDIVRGADASMRRENDPDKTEYAEIIHPNPPLSKKEELRKSRENLADPAPELTTTPDGKKEAAV